MQLLARIAASKNTFSFDVTVVSTLEKYLEATDTEVVEKVDEAGKLQSASNYTRAGSRRM